jgi:hypothetical protein
MKSILLACLLTLGAILSAHAQFVEASYGPSYTQQAFYQLSTDNSVNLPNDAWDIAFTTQGLQDAGLFINEAAGSGGTELALFLVPGKTFEETITQDELGERLFNDEQNWQFGAFNQMRAQGDPFDYGWGRYNPTDMAVEGTQLFALQLRDGSFRKLEISALNGTIYEVRHAAFDGSGEVVFSLNKAEYPDTGLVFYSLTDNQAVTDIPSTGEWDLLFTRYSTPLDDGTGNTLNYLLTGTLSGVNVEVAQADGIDPQTVNYEDYTDAYESVLDVIGYDWKSFDLDNFAWSLPADRAYFVKTDEGKIWKIVFIDFEGSSTGNTVFEKTDLGIVNTVDHSLVEDFTVFPNPARTQATVSLTLKHAASVQLSLFNAAGQRVWSAADSRPAGFQVLEIPVSNLSAGTYWLSIQSPATTAITQPIIVTP